MARRPANKSTWTLKQWGDYVQERSDQLYNDQAEYRKAAEGWLDCWKLKAFEEDIKSAEAEGKILVTPNDPYNIIKLTERLLGGPMRIDAVAPDDTKASRAIAEKRELWLGGFFNRQQMETGINVRRQAIWWAAVRGRMALDVRWVKEVLPSYYKDKRLPIMVRCLDPIDVLQQDSDFGWPEFVIHRYNAPVHKIRDRWGKDGWKALPEDRYDDVQMIPVSDYWDAEWNVLVVEGQPVRKVKHEYPRIPIILAYADATPLSDPEWRGMSILHPIQELYKLKAKVWSYVTTGLMWYFWPALFLQNEATGQVHDSIEMTPGKVSSLFPGEKLITIPMNPNVPLAEVMQQAVAGAIQDATYPRTLYGAEPGVEVAGYALANLSSAARGRTGPLQEPAEWAFAQACELVLDLAHERGAGKVDVWSAQAEQPGYMLFNLKDAKLQQHMPLRVSIALDLPKDEQARAMRGLQEIEAKVLSRQTYREQFLTEVANGELEGMRVLREIAMMDDNIKKEMVAQAYKTITGKTLPGSEPQEGMMPSPMGPPMEPGMGGPPPGMPPEGMPPMGGPPPMGPEGMMPPGLPPGMGLPPPGMGGTPGMGPMGGPETGLPPGALPPQAMMALPPQMMPAPPPPPEAPPIMP